MALMAGFELPVKVVREQIASAVELIVQQSRLRDGSRKITYVSEVAGMEGDKVVLQGHLQAGSAPTSAPQACRPIFLPTSWKRPASRSTRKSSCRRRVQPPIAGDNGQNPNDENRITI